MILVSCSICGNRFRSSGVRPLNEIKSRTSCCDSVSERLLHVYRSKLAQHVYPQDRHALLLPHA